MPNRLPHFFTDDQVARLRAVRKFTRDRVLLDVLLDTGLRASELLALNYGDVSDDRLFVRNGKGGRCRFVPLTRRAAQALSLTKLCVRRPYEPLFVNHITGNRLSRRGLHRILQSHFKAAGLVGSAHTCRHTAATCWLNHGVGLRSVQAMLGHADLSTTAIYLGVAVDGLVGELRRAMVY